MKTELVWEGKYDEYGNRRPVRLPDSPLPLQRIETIDEPRDARKAQAHQLGLPFSEEEFRQQAHRGDKHHIFPRRYLQRQGLNRGRYNQIANFVMAQSEINIAIGDKPPEVYFREIAEQVNGGPKRYGGITDPETLRQNFEENCLPTSLLDGQVPDYETFLAERRRRMALYTKHWFEVL